MGYFSAKGDETFIGGFHADVMKLLGMEKIIQARCIDDGSRFDSENELRAEVRRLGMEIPEYVAVRERVAKGTPRARRIANQCGVNIRISSYPAPITGGTLPPVHTDILVILLNDFTYSSPDSHYIKDTLDQIVGESQEYTRRQFRRLVNPFFWLLEALAFVLRIPFLILETAGIDGSKYEAMILGKIVKGVLLVLLVIFFGLKREEIKEILLRPFKHSEKVASEPHH